MRSNYNLDDLIKCWNKLNITKGDVVYVTGNLSYLGLYKTPKKILPDYYNTLINAIGKKGTIVFPTHSWTLVKSNKTFSPLAANESAKLLLMKDLPSLGIELVIRNTLEFFD